MAELRHTLGLSYSIIFLKTNFGFVLQNYLGMRNDFLVNVLKYFYAVNISASVSFLLSTFSMEKYRFISWFY